MPPSLREWTKKKLVLINTALTLPALLSLSATGRATPSLVSIFNHSLSLAHRITHLKFAMTTQGCGVIAAIVRVLAFKYSEYLIQLGSFYRDKLFKNFSTDGILVMLSIYKK